MGEWREWHPDDDGSQDDISDHIGEVSLCVMEEVKEEPRAGFIELEE